MSSEKDFVPVKRIRGHTSDVVDVKYSPSAAYVATVSADNILVIWDTTDWSVVTVVEDTRQARAVAWHPLKDELLYAGYDGVFHLTLYHVAALGKLVCGVYAH
jgi:WD40 repeat protein